jgi:hypothetical protein
VALVPLAAIHSTHDEFVPLAEARDILRARRCALAVLDGAGARSSVQRQARSVRGQPAGGTGVDRALGGVTSRAWRQVARVLPAAAGVAVFAAALQMLHRELEAVTWGALSADVARTSPALIAWAASLTALNYAVLTGYDFLAFASIGKRLARARVAATAFLAYAVANNVGFAVVSGASVRYRFYSRDGSEGARQRHGGADGARVDLGQGSGLRVVRARHGTDVGL